MTNNNIRTMISQIQPINTKKLIHLWIVRLFLFSLTVIFLTGCGKIPAEPTHQATQLVTSATFTIAPPTATILLPTATFTPMPPSETPTPTQTSTPTDTPSPTETPTETLSPPTPSGENAIYVYYIQLDTGGLVSCGDSLIKANTGVWRTSDVEKDVATALKRLFFKREFFGSLYNPVYLSNLEVSNVSFAKYYGEVSIDLNGTYVRSGDRCDDSRVRAQVWSTVRQFPEVKKVNILLNGNLLGDILATGK